MPQYYVLTFADVAYADESLPPLCVADSEELVKVKQPLNHIVRRSIMGLN